MKILLAAALAAVLATSAHAGKVTIEIPDGWEFDKEHSRGLNKAKRCDGTLSVDYSSPKCEKLPPKYPGGPSGKLCPFTCERT